MQQQINLLDSLPKPPVVYLTAPLMLGILGVCLLFALITISIASWKNFSLQAQYQQVTSQREKIEKGLLTMTKAAQSNTQLVKIKKIIAETNKQIVEQKRLLAFAEDADLENSDGFSNYMQSLATQIVPGMWFDEIIIQKHGREIILRGKTQQAETVMAFLEKLAKEKSFKGKKFFRYELKKASENENILGFELRTGE